MGLKYTLFQVFFIKNGMSTLHYERFSLLSKFIETGSVNLLQSDRFCTNLLAFPDCFRENKLSVAFLWMRNKLVVAATWSLAMGH